MDIRLSNTVLNRRRIDRIYADAVMRNLSMGDSDIIATYEDYPEPVRQLLFIGDRESDAKETWLDYPTQFALTGDHADALIRMACDQALHAEEHGSPAVWSPVHAWRALGQLRIAAAIVPMLSLLKIGEDDDFVDAEFPIVLGMIGPAAIEPIEQFLNDPEVEIFAACSALSALEEIANRHDTSRQVCIGVLVRLLERHPTSNVILNGFVVAKLMNLKAIDAIDTIRGAFARGAVDISIPGDMEDVEIDLGLRTCRETPRPRYDIFAGDPWLREADDVEDEDGIDEPVTRAVKVGRNEPCPCGSGKKYKKCCLP